ncbi:MAG: hypothetical protein FWG37_05400 [Clostridia bacterium]|nr:hypothetical protein [Clostridia bacterium]
MNRSTGRAPSGYALSATGAAGPLAARPMKGSCMAWVAENDAKPVIMKGNVLRNDKMIVKE